MKARATWWSVLVVALGAAPALAADDPLVGTFRLSGRQGARSLSGPVVIREREGQLVLSGTLGTLGAVELPGSREGSSWRFATPVATGGMTGVLVPGQPEATAPALTLTFTQTRVGAFSGTGAGPDGRKTMTLELTRKRRALITYATGYGVEDNTFAAYGRQVRTYWRALGLEVDFVPAASWDAVISALQAAGDAGTPYVRVLSVGHGGWDGPIYRGQLSPWYGGAGWTGLVAAYRHGTAPESKMYVSACHGGGSDKWEITRGVGRTHDKWVDELARATGRQVAGPAGITSTTSALRQVRALEGAGTVVQETRFASADGVRVVKAGGTPAIYKVIPWADVDAAEAAATAP